MEKDGFIFNQDYFIIFAINKLKMDRGDAEALAFFIDNAGYYDCIDEGVSKEFQNFYGKVIECEKSFRILVVNTFNYFFSHGISTMKFRDKNLDNICFDKLGISDAELQNFANMLKSKKISDKAKVPIDDNYINGNKPKNLNEYIDVLERNPEIIKYFTEDACYAI